MSRGMNSLLKGAMLMSGLLALFSRIALTQNPTVRGVNGKRRGRRRAR